MGAADLGIRPSCEWLILTAGGTPLWLFVVDIRNLYSTVEEQSASLIVCAIFNQHTRR
jgi:hypothetical protein